jgi:hypothetical protein
VLSRQEQGELLKALQADDLKRRRFEAEQLLKATKR